MRARNTLRPVKSQQRPEDFWSVTPFEGTSLEKYVSVSAGFSAASAS